jgi:predicted small lipoprotein YifL
VLQHIVSAGAAIVCLGCGTEGRLPLPKADNYADAVQAFDEAHRLCRAVEGRS